MILMPQFLGGSFQQDELTIVGKHLEKSEQMCSLGHSIYTYSYFEKQSFPKFKTELPYNPELQVLNINTEEIKSDREKICFLVLIASFSIIAIYRNK